MRTTWVHRSLGGAITLVLAMDLIVVAVGTGSSDVTQAAPAAPTTTTTIETPSTTTTATPAAAQVTSPPLPPSTAITSPQTTTTVVPRPTRACCADWTIEPYRGVGAWVDVFDWTFEHAWTRGRPTVGPDQVAAMADSGVDTLFIQTARTNGSTDIAEPDRLQRFIDEANAHGIHVVGWYLPTLEDVEKDLRRMTAATTLDLDGFTVDIESTEIEDVAERNRRLIEVSRRFDAVVGQGVVGTVVINAFAIEQVRREAWPGFPWAEIDPYYDVWQPMAYVTYRAGTEWRDAERYTAASIDAMRRHVGDEPIAAVTGEADDMTTDDIRGFVRASRDRRAVGGGIYDWSVATSAMWDAMAPLAA